MKQFHRILYSAILLAIAVSFQSCGEMGSKEQASEKVAPLSKRASDILKKHCASCHEGSSAKAPPHHVLDTQALINEGWIIPGDPGASPLYISLHAGMPKNQPKLHDDQIKVIEDWILDLDSSKPKPAKLAINSRTNIDFGNITTGTTSDQLVTVVNEGTITAMSISAVNLAAPFSFKGGTFPGAGGNCAATLAGNQSCLLALTFSPTVSGSASQSLRINFTSSTVADFAEVQLLGLGVDTPIANLVLSDVPTFQFTATAIGQNRDKNVTLTNMGLAQATNISANSLSAPFSYKGGVFPGTGGNCAATLAAGASCTIVLNFAPSAVGNFASALQIQYNNALSNRNVSLNLAGNGLSSAEPMYFSQIKAIISAPSNCMGCHDGATGWNVTYLDLRNFKTQGTTPAINPGDFNSRFIQRLIGTTMGQQMGVPPRGDLSLVNRQKIIDWILAGAPNDPASTAILAFSDAPTYVFSPTSTGTTREKTVTVTNTGTAAATALVGTAGAAPFAFKGGSYPGTGGTCSTTLAAGATCDLVVTYSPANIANHSGSVSLQFNDGVTNRTSSLALTGSGIAPALANLVLSDSPSYNFIAERAGQVKGKVVTVTNNGTGAASALTASGLAAPYRFRGGAYPGTGGTCAATLAAAASCTIVVEFAPTASGTFNDTLVVSYNNGSATVNRNLDVVGTGSTPSTGVYYANIQPILANTTNCQSCHASASGWGSTYSALMAFKTSGSAAAITPGDINSRFITRLVSATMGPQMGISPHGNISAANRQTLIDWIVAGAPETATVSQANIVISDGPTHNFGSVATGSFAEKTFTLNNSGNLNATSLAGAGLAAPFSFKGGNYPGTGGTCAASLASGANCTIVVRFTPTAAGTFNDTIEINYMSGTSARTSQRAISGTGTAPATANIVTNPTPSHNFGLVVVGSNAEQTVTLTNNGTAVASAINVTGLAAPFAFKGGSFPGTGGNCTASLAIGASCNIVLRFAPTAAGTFTAGMNINYSSSRITTLNLSGQGTATSTTPVYYSRVRAIVNASCVACHSMGSTYNDLKSFRYQTTNYNYAGSSIIPGDAVNSRFARIITSGMHRIDGSVSKMGTGTFGVLTAAEVNDILAWIAQGALNDPSGTMTQAFTPVIGDRYYVSSILLNIYGANATATVNAISRKADIFGSSCFEQDNYYTTTTGRGQEKRIPMVDSCMGANSEDARINADTLPMSNTVREATRITTCMRLANSDGLTNSALTKATLSGNSTFDQNNITKAYQLFYPGASPSTEALMALKDIGDTAKASASIMTSGGKSKDYEGWRFIFAALCTSSSWTAP